MRNRAAPAVEAGVAFWLRILAADREVPADEVLRQARSEGISASSLFRARRLVGVARRKVGWQGPWLLQLKRSTAPELRVAPADPQGNEPAAASGSGGARSYTTMIVDERCAACQWPDKCEADRTCWELEKRARKEREAAARQARARRP